MYKDEKLKAIYIVDEHTKELIASIDKDGNLIQANNVSVIMDYTKDEDKVLEDRDGKIFWIGEDKDA